jgi:hypothetical protein
MEVNDPKYIHNNSCEISPLDHIAEGVEVKYDLLTGYTQSIIESTAVIARDLGISEDHIRRWVRARQEQSMSRICHICFLLDKIKNNYRAQVALGLIRPYQGAVNTINQSDRGKL